MFKLITRNADVVLGTITSFVFDDVNKVNYTTILNKTEMVVEVYELCYDTMYAYIDDANELPHDVVLMAVNAADNFVDTITKVGGNKYKFNYLPFAGNDEDSVR